MTTEQTQPSLPLATPFSGQRFCLPSARLRWKQTAVPAAGQSGRHLRGCPPEGLHTVALGDLQDRPFGTYPCSWVACYHSAPCDPCDRHALWYLWDHAQRCGGSRQGWWSDGCRGGAARGVEGVGGRAGQGTCMLCVSCQALMTAHDCMAWPAFV